MSYTVKLKRLTAEERAAYKRLLVRSGALALVFLLVFALLWGFEVLSPPRAAFEVGSPWDSSTWIWRFLASGLLLCAGVFVGAASRFIEHAEASSEWVVSNPLSYLLLMVSGVLFVYGLVLLGNNVWNIGHDGLARFGWLNAPIRLYGPDGGGYEVERAAFSPDGGRIAVAGHGKIFLWDVDGGKPLVEWSSPPENEWDSSAPFAAIAFSPDGQRVFAARTGTLTTWHSGSGKVEHRILAGRCLALSPDGQRVLVKTRAVPIAVIIEECGEQRVVSRCEMPDAEGVACGALSADNQYAATGGYDGSVRLWDAATGRELHRLKGHTAAIAEIAFSPDGGQLISAGRDKTVRLWDAGSGKELRQFRGHRGPVNSVAFSPDGARILSGGKGPNAEMIVWDAGSGTELRRLPLATGSAMMVAFSPDGRRAVTGEYRLELWSMPE